MDGIGASGIGRIRGAGAVRTATNGGRSGRCTPPPKRVVADACVPNMPGAGQRAPPPRVVSKLFSAENHARSGAAMVLRRGRLDHLSAFLIAHTRRVRKH